MAARKNRGTAANGWGDLVRDRIRASMLEKRLISHALGEIELSATQIRAIEILFRKVLPDLAQVEHSGEFTHNYVARLPQPVSDVNEWKKQTEATLQ